MIFFYNYSGENNMKNKKKKKEDLSPLFDNLKPFFDNLFELKNYIEENNINLKELKNDKYDILILAIENNASLETIKYIVEKTNYETFNYSIRRKVEDFGSSDYVIRYPLNSALANDNYEIASYLIGKKADINFNYGSLIKDLLHRDNLNLKNVKFILNNGFDPNNIDSQLMKELLKNDQVPIFKYLMKHIIFDNHFILLLLNLYKTKSPLTNIDMAEIFNKERNKSFVITEEVYSTALKLPEKPEIINFLFDYDNPDEIICRIHSLNLLDKAVQNNNMDFIKQILKYDNHCNYDRLTKYLPSDIEKRKHNKKSNKKRLLNKETIQFLMLTALETVKTLKKDVKGKRKENEFDNNESKISISFIPYYDASYFNDILNMSIRYKDRKFVQYLLKDEKYQYSLDLNHKSIKGEYPIFTAIQEDDIIILKYLIDHGANYTIKDYDGKSVLVKALTMINKPTTNSSILNYILYLLDSKINMNEKDEMGNTLLFNAIDVGDKNFNHVISLVNYGINHGMDRTIKNANGDTPLTFTYNMGHFKLFNYLVNCFDINEKDDQGYPPLYYAVNSCDKKTTKHLLDMNVDVSFRDEYGNTLLHIAINKKEKDIIKFFLENKKININERNQFGETPLISLSKCSFLNNEVEIFKKILKNGGHINLTDNLGNSVLFYVVQNNQSDLIKWFIKKGANVHIKNKKGYTALDYALEGKYYNSAESLCNFKCEVGHKEKITSSLLQDLINDDHVSLFQYLYVQVPFDIQNTTRMNVKSSLEIAVKKQQKEIKNFLNAMKDLEKETRNIMKNNENDNENEDMDEDEDEDENKDKKENDNDVEDKHGDKKKNDNDNNNDKENDNKMKNGKKNEKKNKKNIHNLNQDMDSSSSTKIKKRKN